MSYVKHTVFRSTLSTIGMSIFLAFPAGGVEAPLTATDAVVAQAQQEPLIARGDAADQPSQVAMDQDTAASGRTDSPADAASDSVSQARKEHAAGRYDAARADLKSAAQFFDKVALSEGKFAEDASHTLAQESRDTLPFSRRRALTP